MGLQVVINNTQYYEFIVIIILLLDYYCYSFGFSVPIVDLATLSLEMKACVYSVMLS